MMITPSPSGNLQLGHIFAATGIELSEVLVIRHTYLDDGIPTPNDATPANVLAYTREQDVITNKFPKNPPRHWLVFMSEGGRRSRLIASYDNLGEVASERTDLRRNFDLRVSGFLSSLANRLVVEWSKDTINWAKPGGRTSPFPVLEIADPEVVAFPGFDRVRIDHAELQAVISDSRYADWRAALGAVQGIYLIADSSTGELYVGKADGRVRLLGRWTAYARDGHGGNVALRELAKNDVSHRRHFVFSILRVFGPNTTSAEVDEAESHYKRALMTREHGLNRN